MKALLIDPFDRTISMINISSDWREISRLLGCEYFTVAGYYDKDVVYCDDEGLLHGPTDFVSIQGFGHPLAGRVLMLGSTPDGDSTDVNTTALDMMEVVDFYTFNDVMEKYSHEL